MKSDVILKAMIQRLTGLYWCERYYVILSFMKFGFSSGQVMYAFSLVCWNSAYLIIFGKRGITSYRIRQEQSFPGIFLIFVFKIILKLSLWTNLEQHLQN